MSFLLALDWGQKKVGFATADAEGLVVTPQGHFRRKEAHKNPWIINKFDRAEIQKLIERFEVEEIILGLPLHSDGSESDSSKWARKLAEILARDFQKKVSLVNEYLSSWAHQGAQDDDAEAAATLLRDYFSMKERGEIKK